ncbi:MAG: Stp1/IreP family PP2C-type Ser/Thr phosphatase [Gammaproteobacteria bacterium]|nr:Stp1/IreP family PP2C-type Ser/Thr phosphatase [Gammaproteobacteria bacterium]
MASLHEGNISLSIFGLTDVGAVRSNNEDSIDWNEEQGLAILADGMGGHNAGEVASKLAVDTVKHSLSAVLGSSINTDELKAGISQAMLRANAVVFEHAMSNTGCNGMGTTLVVVSYHAEHLVCGNIGDSRVYRYRENELTQLTRDHSLVSEWVERGFMTKEEAEKSQQKNIITRAVGLQNEVESDLYEFDVQAGDMYLLCSDGLTDVVNDNAIQQALVQSKDEISKMPRKLVDMALDAGGPDNISVIVVSVEHSS